MKLYVYEFETLKVVAIIDAETNVECEAIAMADWDRETYAATYTPAFGANDGLISTI